MDAREIEEQYRDWVKRLRQSIAEGSGTEVCEGTRMVATLPAIINSYYPQVWREKEDDREIVDLLGQARERIRRDILTSNIPEDDTLEHYLSYFQHICERCENVRHLLAQWSHNRKHYVTLLGV